jgi:hypothetical protein
MNTNRRKSPPKRKPGEPYVCPTCFRQDGDHLYDCEQRSLGAGIRDPKERERVMLAALADEFEL